MEAVSSPSIVTCVKSASSACALRSERPPRGGLSFVLDEDQEMTFGGLPKLARSRPRRCPDQGLLLRDKRTSISPYGKRQTKIADHEFSSGVGIDFGRGVECVERAGGIDDGRAGIDGDRNTQHFGYLFPGRTPFPGRRGMYRDAA